MKNKIKNFFCKNKEDGWNIKSVLLIIGIVFLFIIGGSLLLAILSVVPVMTIVCWVEYAKTHSIGWLIGAIISTVLLVSGGGGITSRCI